MQRFLLRPQRCVPGAGKVTIATPASIAQSVAFAVPESRVIALEETEDGRMAARGFDALKPMADRTDALLIGPGLSDDAETRDLTAALLGLFTNTEIILDAGAMGIACTPRNGIPFSRPVLLTPHAGEMAHLTDADKATVAGAPAGSGAQCGACMERGRRAQRRNHPYRSA